MISTPHPFVFERKYIYRLTDSSIAETPALTKCTSFIQYSSSMEQQRPYKAGSNAKFGSFKQASCNIALLCIFICFDRKPVKFGLYIVVKDGIPIEMQLLEFLRRDTEGYLSEIL